MGSLGPTELVIVLVIVLVIFGGRKLPELAKSMGESIKEFRRATTAAEGEEPAPDEES